jgi:hypothetical protein
MLPDFPETKLLFGKFFRNYMRRKMRELSPFGMVQIHYLHEGRGMKMVRADESESDSQVQQFSSRPAPPHMRTSQAQDRRRTAPKAISSAEHGRRFHSVSNRGKAATSERHSPGAPSCCRPLFSCSSLTMKNR